MAIPESQLETWSHQGAVTTAKATADSIKHALDNYDNWPEEIEYKTYLQGSYKNDTNIRGDSDVDAIAQLNSTFYSNLSEEQKRYLGISPASYGWEEFRLDVLRALIDYYDSTIVDEGNKSIKIKANNGRLPADIIACAQYRQYFKLNIHSFIEGIIFWTRNEGRKIINYPKIHYQNGVKKHQDTSNWYKPTVRMFKNMRTYLIEKKVITSDIAPSYFLECLLFNVPDNNFSGSYQDTFCDVVNWLNKAGLDDFICQNGQLDLFGSTPEQWVQEKAIKFNQELISLWNNW